MGFVEPTPGVGHLRDLSRHCLANLSVVTQLALEQLERVLPRTSIQQNADGSIFFVATSTAIDEAPKVRWAFLTRDGGRHEHTAYEDESAVREACVIGPWDVGQLLEDLAGDQLDIEEVRAR